MNINVNRQFILLDFDLIDDPRFLDFVSSAEFGTYLILRRFIWRGGEDRPHFLNLHHLYENDKLLVCSISNEKIASLLQLHDLTRVSKQLTKLERYGVVKRIRTGRQNIYVLGSGTTTVKAKMVQKDWNGFTWSRSLGSAQQTWLKKPNQTCILRQVRVGQKSQILI
jgi:hypothetical protein